MTVMQGGLRGRDQLQRRMRERPMAGSHYRAPVSVPGHLQVLSDSRIPSAAATFPGGRVGPSRCLCTWQKPTAFVGAHPFVTCENTLKTTSVSGDTCRGEGCQGCVAEGPLPTMVTAPRLMAQKEAVSRSAPEAHLRNSVVRGLPTN